jgi:DNA-binding CsgD family transcriptional regulator
MSAMLRAVCAAVPASRAYCLVQVPHWRYPTGWFIRGEHEAALRVEEQLAYSFMPCAESAQLTNGYVHLDLDFDFPSASALADSSAQILKRGVGCEVSIGLRDATNCRGLLVLQRRLEQPFSEDERARIHKLQPLATAVISAQVGMADARCETAILRTLGPTPGIQLLMDTKARSIVWGRGTGWGERSYAALEPIEEMFVCAVERAIAARAEDAAPVSSPGSPLGTLAEASTIEQYTPFAHFGAGLRLRNTDLLNSQCFGLSTRERAVARLLIKGYEVVNIAAIFNIAETTVQTYVRRLYGKLGAHNRADVVRLLQATDL